MYHFYRYSHQLVLNMRFLSIQTSATLLLILAGLEETNATMTHLPTDLGQGSGLSSMDPQNLEQKTLHQLYDIKRAVSAEDSSDKEDKLELISQWISKRLVEGLIIRGKYIAEANKIHEYKRDVEKLKSLEQTVKEIEISSYVDVDELTEYKKDVLNQIMWAIAEELRAKGNWDQALVYVHKCIENVYHTSKPFQQRELGHAFELINEYVNAAQPNEKHERVSRAIKATDHLKAVLDAESEEWKTCDAAAKGYQLDQIDLSELAKKTIRALSELQKNVEAVDIPDGPEYETVRLRRKAMLKRIGMINMLLDVGDYRSITPSDGSAVPPAPIAGNHGFIRKMVQRLI